MYYKLSFEKWTWREYDRASTAVRERFRFYLAKRQSFRCYSCGGPISSLSDVHHDHASERIRGLVCRRCNLKMIWLPVR